jgi:hypothetical protein
MTTLAIPRGKSLRHLARHYLEMIVAMVIGMVALGPVEATLFGASGWADLRADPAVRALIMATNMTVAMTAWMCLRRHSCGAIRDMAAAMYGSFLVLFPLLWLGVLSGTMMMTLGHVLMPFAMAAVMLLRPDEYTGHRARTRPSTGILGAPADPK